MEKAKILVFSDDREFVNSLTRSWRQLGYSREFTVSPQPANGSPDLPAAGRLGMNGRRTGDPAGAKNAGEQAGGTAVPTVVLTDGAAGLANLPAGVVHAIVITGGAARPVLSLPEANPGMRVVWIERGGGWADVATALAQETALRLEAQAQVAETKQKLREAERFAALGRFIAEARHGLGNALTGVLGHSELLLLEAGKELEAETRAQVETIHAMSLKIHETFHRLSSLDLELRLAERQAEREQAGPVQ